MEASKINTIGDKCPICRANGLSFYEKKFLGITIGNRLICLRCKAMFQERSGGYMLKSIADKDNAIWKEYASQLLTTGEWQRISDGGVSDAKQREIDIDLWMKKIQSGAYNPSFLGVQSPLMLNVGEETLCILPNVSLKEPRAIRKSSGSYGGPSIRIAKGVSVRLGTFGSTSESHQEIRMIDKGILTLTNKRLVFSGELKTIQFEFRKIIQIDPFTDGIGIHRLGREKTQYLTWIGEIGHIEFSQEDRHYTEPFSGAILQYMIQGAINTSKTE
jgi:hypothetical protein